MGLSWYVKSTSEVPSKTSELPKNNQKPLLPRRNPVSQKNRSISMERNSPQEGFPFVYEILQHMVKIEMRLENIEKALNVLKEKTVTKEQETTTTTFQNNYGGKNTLHFESFCKS